MLPYRLSRAQHAKEARMRQPGWRQLPLIDTTAQAPRSPPEEFEEKLVDLLCQLLRGLIHSTATEARDEQDQR
jgi:hypothetical protein